MRVRTKQAEGAEGGGRFGPAARLTAWVPLLSGAAAPGFWTVLQENGPEFDVLPEFWAVFPALRRGLRNQLRHNPRSEASVSSTPSSAAYETAQNFAHAIEAPRCVPTIR